MKELCKDLNAETERSAGLEQQIEYLKQQHTNEVAALDKARESGEGVLMERITLLEKQLEEAKKEGSKRGVVPESQVGGGRRASAMPAVSVQKVGKIVPAREKSPRPNWEQDKRKLEQQIQDLKEKVKDLSGQLAAR